MDLDLSKLNNIGANKDSTRTARNDQDEPQVNNGAITQDKTLNALKRRLEPQTYKMTLQSQADLKRKDIERAKEAYSYYQDNIKASSRLRSEINKMLANGEDREEVLKKCIECIGKMTGDTAFITQNLKALKS